MSVFALLRRLERMTRPAPSLAHDYDLPVQDTEQESWEPPNFAGAAASLADENNSPGVLLRSSVREDKQQGESESLRPADPQLNVYRSGPLGAAIRSRCPNQGSMCNCTGACLRTPTSPVPPVGVDDPAAGPPPDAAAGSPSWWIDWATPGICEVLAEHQLNLDSRGYTCLCDLRDIADPYDWREHVAPIIAARIENQPADPVRAADERIAAAITEANKRIETGHDIGLTHAAEMFPQHNKFQQ